ncbi:hypothetical protein ACQHIV_42135 (plasmid) [Kribbella sp. GL6]|uniref:hypothetical protein n=1 Tax=Kribbella sp. GL6 TaxID=3419765 RepID=UPI003D074C49
MEDRSSSPSEHKPGDAPVRRTDERTQTVSSTRELVDPASLKKRRNIGTGLVVFAAGVAMFASGWGMWHFFSDLPSLSHWYLVLPMFLLFDSAAVACAWNARINRLSYGRMGTEGWLVWLFAAASGLMSASDTSGRAAAVRFAAPLVAAILFELLIRGERRDLTNHDGPLARIRRRTLARFGLLDDVDQDDEQAARARMAAKLAALAHRVHQLDEGTRARRRAVRRYHRQLQTASVRMGFATDEAMIEEVRRGLDVLYRSVAGTGPDSVADLNVWRSAEPGEIPAAQVAETVAEREAPSAGGQLEMVVGGPLRPRGGPRRRRVGRRLARRRTAARDVATITAQTVDVPAEQPTEKGRRGARSTDLEPVLEQYGEQLADELRTKGKLSRYRVEQTTGLGTRPAERVREAVEERVNRERQAARFAGATG